MLEIGRNLDVEKRKAAYFEVQAILAEQQPALFLVTPTVYWGHRNRWQNLEPTELDGVLWNLESIWAEVDE